MVLLSVHNWMHVCVSGSKSPGLVIVLSISAEWKLIMGVAEITVARPLFLCNYSLSLHFSSARLIFPPRFFLPLSPPSRQALLCLGDLYSRSINLKERERCGDMTVYRGLAWCLLWCHQNRGRDIVCCHVNQRDSCSCRDRHKCDGGMCNC